MSIQLASDLENSIQAIVQSGRFASVDEAMATAAPRSARELTGRSRNSIAYRRVYGFLTLSVMEVIQGHQRVGSAARIQAFRNALRTEEVLVLDEAAADLAGQIAGDLDRVGRPMGRCDPMIAALDITHGLELVTGNTAHYQRLPPLGYPLTLVDWRS